MRREPRKVTRPVRRTKPANSRSVPKWFPAAAAITLATLLCLTVNFRALNDLNRESAEHQQLNEQIRESMLENVSLQEEIHYLRNDKQVKKFGLVRTEEMKTKPAN
jgi:hypothetical protein